MANRNFNFHFPARDRLLEKSAKTLVNIEALELQFNELKEHFIDFKWYVNAAELKELQVQLATIKSRYQSIDENLFTNPTKK